MTSNANHRPFPSDRTKRFGGTTRGFAGIVQAPVPVQTCSLKAETGKDVKTMLVKSEWSIDSFFVTSAQ